MTPKQERLRHNILRAMNEEERSGPGLTSKQLVEVLSDVLGVLANRERQKDEAPF